MGGRLLNEVARLLAELESTQGELQALFHRKKDVLRKPQPEALLEIAQEEAKLVERLQGHLSRREDVLKAAGQGGYVGETLGTVVRAIGGEGAEALAERIERLQRDAEVIRRESWVQWIVTHRSFKQYTEMLELIANQGQRSPSYGGARHAQSGAGALLDASA